MDKTKDREHLLRAFQQKIGYTFEKTELLEEALTHSSYANESGLLSFNERLEFLGDAVLELVTSEKLYSDHPKLAEGQLTHLRAQLVCKNSLSEWAEYIGLSPLIRVGKSLLKNGPTQSMEADAAEALFGAVFLESGYASARSVILKFLENRKELASLDSVDPKTELQLLLQKKNSGVPYYKTIDRKGPDHALNFKVQVTLGDRVLAEAWGLNIQEAEFKAAEIVLEKIEKEKIQISKKNTKR